MTDLPPIRHHIPDSVLAAYAAGSLDEAFALVVACHLSLCDTCRATVAAVEATGGALLEETEPAPLPPGALDAMLARLRAGPDDTADDQPPAASTAAPSDTAFPAPLGDYAAASAETVRWRSVGGGVRQVVLPCAGRAKARLLYIPAGAEMPDHSHRGMEMTMVLQGAFSDEVDRFTPGDVEMGDEDLHHTPVAETGRDCICLAATDAPLRFRGWLPRLAQPFIGI
ncbi:MAG: ChrR family anti-sigma-E factor [Celeribacter sp.]|jgi:putative transcriptional regulator